jgi:hypothetical protein
MPPVPQPRIAIRAIDGALEIVLVLVGAVATQSVSAQEPLDFLERGITRVRA